MKPFRLSCVTVDTFRFLLNQDVASRIRTVLCASVIFVIMCCVLLQIGTTEEGLYRGLNTQDLQKAKCTGTAVRVFGLSFCFVSLILLSRPVSFLLSEFIPCVGFFLNRTASLLSDCFVVTLELQISESWNTKSCPLACKAESRKGSSFRLCFFCACVFCFSSEFAVRKYNLDIMNATG